MRLQARGKMLTVIAHREPAAAASAAAAGWGLCRKASAIDVVAEVQARAVQGCPEQTLTCSKGATSCAQVTLPSMLTHSALRPGQSYLSASLKSSINCSGRKWSPTGT